MQGRETVGYQQDTMPEGQMQAPTRQDTSGTPGHLLAAGTTRCKEHRGAANGQEVESAQYATRAKVSRNSLQDDADILGRRGWSHRSIADALGVGRSTVARWLA